MSGPDPAIAVRAARGGHKASKSFNELFAPLQFVPPSSSMKAESIIRDTVLTEAARYFNADEPGPMTNAYSPSKRNVAKLDNGPTPDGLITFFLPWPQLTATGAEIASRETRKTLFRRMDVQKGLVLRGVEADSLQSYFRYCKGLGVPDSSDRKWVWLTRCIAPRQHIVYPYTAGTDRAWTLQLAVGGNATAQAKAEHEGHYRVPPEDIDADVTKEYWAMLFSGIKEPEPIRDRLVHIEAPAPREQLLSEMIGENVVALIKQKAAIGGGYSNETRDAPARDKPSVIAEVAGAVAVSAAVALVTGVVAAVV